MAAILLPAAVPAGCAVVLTVLVLLARRMRRRGSAGAAIGAAISADDEAMHPLGSEAAVELRAQDDRTGSVAAPGDR